MYRYIYVTLFVQAILLNATFTHPAVRQISLERSVSFHPVAELYRCMIGPYFVAFSNLKQALEDNLPIRTNARACTILPNFVG